MSTVDREGEPISEVRGNAIAPYKGNGEMTQSVFGQLTGRNTGRICSNLPADPEARYIMQARCESPEALSLRDKLNQEITIRYWYCKTVECYNERTGEMVPAIMTCIIDAEDRVYRAVSDGVAQSISLLATTFGQKPFDPPRRMMVRETQLRGGKRFMQLVPAPQK